MSKMNAMRWAGPVAALLGFVFNTAALYAGLTSQYRFVIWDIHPTFVAADAVLHGQDPYAPEVTLRIQQDIYGRPARPGEDVQGFAYPAYVAYLAAPFALLPFQWAQAAWLSLLMVAAVAGLALSIATWGWPRRPIQRVLLLLWGLAFYGIVWGFLLGQIALVIFALLALLVWAARRGTDVLAGVALGLMLIKPQTAFLIMPAVFTWAVLTRRRRLVVSAIVTAVLLVLLPTVFQPGWILSFARRMGEYNDYSPFIAPALVVAQRCCAPVAGAVAAVLIAAIAGLVLYGWWAARGGGNGGLLWAAGMTLIATTLIAPQISTVNQVILLIPIVGQLNLLATRGRAGGLAVAGLLLAWGAGLWVLSLLPPISTATPRYPVEHQILSPLVPLSLGVLWVASRPGLMRLGEDAP
jgi:hypothetical protein